MKNQQILRWAVFFTLVLCAVPAFADIGGGSGVPFILRFDEDGIATYTKSDGSTGTVNGNLVEYKLLTTGATYEALTYILPATVYAGDVKICEPSPNNSGTDCSLSDLLRFTNDKADLKSGFGADRMLYFSSYRTGVLADQQSPPTPWDNAATVTEVGDEGVNGFVWKPSLDFPDDNEYYGISDVPEPNTLILVGAAGLLVALLTRSRRTAQRCIR